MEEEDNKDSEGDSIYNVHRYMGRNYYELPSDFLSSNSDELRADQGMVDYFFDAGLDIPIFKNCTDAEKLSRSKFKNKTSLLTMSKQKAYLSLSLHDVASVLDQAHQWNGGPLPFSEERWELLEALETIDESKLEELLWLKLKKIHEFNETLSLRSFAVIEHQDFTNRFRDSIKRLPIAQQWLDFLKDVSEGRNEIAEDSTSATSKEEKGGISIEFKPELTDTRESVVNILNPLEGAFLTQPNFEEAVNRLCQYFDGETQQTPTPLRVRKGNSKRLGKALGEMHKDLRHKDSIGRDYLQFAKDTFDCFENQVISKEKLNSTNLYKYMTGKG